MLKLCRLFDQCISKKNYNTISAHFLLLNIVDIVKTMTYTIKYNLLDLPRVSIFTVYDICI